MLARLLFRPLAVALAVALAAALAAGMALAPLAAAADEPKADPETHGKPLHEELLDQFLKEEGELNEKAHAAVEQMLQALAPVIEQLSSLIRDMPEYEAPEILPNGDIIIRRKRAAPDPDAEIKT